MKLAVRTAAGAAAVLLTPTTAGASLAEPPPASAVRETTVVFHNDTDCALLQVGKETYQGIWVSEPDASVSAHGTDHFRTEGDGVSTGTEAAIRYRTVNCSRADKEIRFHWDNPYRDRNGYDFIGTDGAFITRYTGGNGNRTTVEAYVS
ncbi:hypothetical protein ACFQ08_21155 [Streptosporangium algeriense]|uniref:Crystal protein ET79 n=1 Tax=Streptosporangium algeriense TaxID=1682748 RepID=A0ABW3DWK7_9ACTN